MYCSVIHKSDSGGRHTAVNMPNHSVSQNLCLCPAHESHWAVICTISQQMSCLIASLYLGTGKSKRRWFSLFGTPKAKLKLDCFAKQSDKSSVCLDKTGGLQLCIICIMHVMGNIEWWVWFVTVVDWECQKWGLGRMQMQVWYWKAQLANNPMGKKKRKQSKTTKQLPNRLD